MTVLALVALVKPVWADDLARAAVFLDHGCQADAMARGGGSCSQTRSPVFIEAM
jgi:hypothetical protein